MSESIPDRKGRHLDICLDNSLPVETGGTEEGRRLNRLLARVAGERGLAIGTGSIRVMLRHPEVADHFSL